MSESHSISNQLPTPPTPLHREGEEKAQRAAAPKWLHAARGKSGRWADAPRRLLTLFVGAPTVFSLVALGMPFYDLLVLTVGLLMAWEYTRIVRPPSRPARLLNYALVAVGIMAVANAQLGYFALVAGVGVVVCLFAPLSPASATAHPPTTTLTLVRLTLLAGLYIGLPMGTLLLVRGMEQGLAWTVLLLATNWTTDAFALIGGRVLGHHKLAPGISEGKTTEGALTGLIAGLLMAFLVGLLAKLPFAPVLIAGLLIPPLTLVGDLIESQLKRNFGVKDASGLLPGHGGFLDRVDGLLLAAPALALLLAVFAL